MDLQTLQSKFFEELGGSKNDVFKKTDSFLLIKKWNWDYPQALDFQKLAHQYVNEDNARMVLVICNHPTCFTMGRGLQKKSGKTIENLVETSLEESQNFPYPVYKINRGGGLTYHYPGQLIVYPILKLGGSRPSLSELAKMIFNSLIKATKELTGIDLHENSGDLIGLWAKTNLGDRKLASFGIGIERFITQHGVAFNLENGEVFDFLKTIYPCGLNGNTYQFLNSISKENLIVDEFSEIFKKYFFKDISSHMIQ